MGSSRRRLLQLAGGAGAGLIFTPAPWRLLGDSAIWTQNWSWLPKTPRGALTSRATHCTLCPAGCAVCARSVGGIPTGLWPAGEPLCPAGFAGHHLAWHPQRLREARHDGSPDAAANEVEALRGRLEAIRARRSRECFAVLDLAPGRTASLIHRRLLARIDNGAYLEPPAIEGATARAVSALLPGNVRAALDLQRTKTLLSVGTPVADGWGSPARVTRALRRFRLVHAEAQQSRAADIADEWLRIHPGSETALLAGIAGILIEEGLESPSARRCPDYGEFRAALRRARGETGLAPDRLRQLARTLAREQPAAVVADGDPANGPYAPETQAAAAALNVLLGAVGVPGGFAPRMEVPAPNEWAGVPVSAIESLEDGSIGALLIDEPLPGCSLPWTLVERKLAKDALVAACAWSAVGVSRRAEWIVPAPVFLETLQDTPPAPDAVEASFRISDAFLPPPPDAIDAVTLLARLAGEEMAPAKALEERAAAIHASGNGALTKAGDAEALPVTALDSAEFWQSLKDGGEWRWSKETGGVEPARLFPPGAGLSVEPVRAAERVSGWRPAGVSPLLAKLWQESELKERPGAPRAGGSAS
ncbi:MAG: molybdopterin-dependent oxidoreductase [Bryobacteraceae bacterium]|nr:molybdopterin-dependent oxidoreductase [Bryobacteraceae bacterium]